MIKVKCPSCASQYDLDESRLPPAGLKMRCPKCSSTFHVLPSGETSDANKSPAVAKPIRKKTQVGMGATKATPEQSPGAPPGRTRKTTEAGVAPAPDAGADLPALKGSHGAVAPSFPGPGGDADLPAPKSARGPIAPAFPGAGPQRAVDNGADLPAPKKGGGEGDGLGGIDLGLGDKAGAGTGSGGAPATPKWLSAHEEISDLPGIEDAANEASFADVDLPAPKGQSPKAKAPPPTRKARTADVDLPAPKGQSPKAKAPPPTRKARTADADLPALKGKGPRTQPPPPTNEASFADVDLPAPKSQGPKTKPPPPARNTGSRDFDLPALKGGTKARSNEASFDDVDLPAAKGASKPKASKDEASFADVDLPAPKGGGPKTKPPAGPAKRPSREAHFGDVDLPGLKGKGPETKPPASGVLDVDLPAPKTSAMEDMDLPAPKAKSTADEASFADFDLPAPKAGGKAADLDLPAPKGRAAPDAFADFNLPAPKSEGARKGGGLADLDLPAPKIGGNAFADLDLPAPKGGIDLPAPKGGGGFADLDLPAPKGSGSGPLADLDLPGPKAGPIGGGLADLDLPAPKASQANAPVLPDFDLPPAKPSAPPVFSGLPAALGGEGDFGDLDFSLPSEAPDPLADTAAAFDGREMDLELPEPGAFGASASDFELDLPEPSAPAAPTSTSGNFDLDLPEPKSAQPTSTSGDFDLELPEPKSAQPSSTSGDFDLELPEPKAASGSIGELDLELPEPPAGSAGGGFELPMGGGDLDLPEPPGMGGGESAGDLTADGRAGAGGLGFGELDLGGGDGLGDGMEFDEIPEEAESTGTKGGSPDKESIAVVDSMRAPAEDETREAPPTKKKSKYRGLIVMVIVLVALGGVGVGLGFTEHGYFGAYALEQFLPAAGDDASASRVIKEAEELAADDTYAGVRGGLRILSAARNQMGLNRRLLARSLLHESLFQLQFGGSAGSAGRSVVILARLEKRGGAAPGMDLARAADALRKGNLNDARRNLGLAGAGNDPYVHLVAGEIELRDGAFDEAVEAFGRALEHGGGARASWGLARAHGGAGNSEAQAAALEDTLTASPGHAGALTAKAQLKYAAAENGEALTLARQASGLEPIGEETVRSSPALRAAALTLVGRLEELAGHRQRAREAFDAALATNSFTAEALVGAGRVLLKDGRHRDALTRFESALSRQSELENIGSLGRPLLVEAKLGAAQAMLAVDRPRDAWATLEALSAQYTDDAEIALWLGRSAEALDDREAAETHFREAIRLAPNEFEPYMALARLFFAMEQHGDAAAVLTQARDQVQDSSEVRRMLGEAELERNNLEDAVREFRKAVELAPNDAASRFGLGVALRRSGKLTEAAEALDEAARLDSAWPGLALQRGLVYESQGLAIRAVESYKAALVERPEDPELLLRLGSAQVTAGQIDEADATLRHVMRQLPNSPEAEHFLGRVAFARGDLPTSLTHFGRAVELDATQGEYSLYVAWASLEMDNLGGALEAVQKALDNDPSLGDAYWIRGRVRVRLGAVRDALQDLQKTLELKPGRFEAYASMGECYDDLRQLPQAIDAYETALGQDNRRGEWWYRLGRLQMDAGRRADAARSLARATVIGDAADPRPGWLADAHRVQADASRLGGDHPSAIQHYRRYLEIAPQTAIDRNEVRDQLMSLGAAP